MELGDLSEIDDHFLAHFHLCPLVRQTMTENFSETHAKFISQK